METKTFHANRKTLRDQLIFGWVCLAMSLLTMMHYLSPTRFESMFSSVAWGCVGLVGVLVSLWLIRRVVLDRKRTKPLLTIDADGIEWDGIGDVGQIPWSAIQSTTVRNHAVGIGKVRYLVIEVTNPDDILASAASTKQRKRMQQTLSFLGSPAFIPEKILDAPLEDIQLEVENRLYERRKQQEANGSWIQPDIPAEQPLRVGNR